MQACGNQAKSVAIKHVICRGSARGGAEDLPPSCSPTVSTMGMEIYRSMFSAVGLCWHSIRLRSDLDCPPQPLLSRKGLYKYQRLYTKDYNYKLNFLFTLTGRCGSRFDWPRLILFSAWWSTVAGVVAAHVPEHGADGERQAGGQQAVRVLQGLPAAGAWQLPPVQRVALRPRHLHAVHLLLHRHRLQPAGPGRSVISQSLACRVTGPLLDLLAFRC